MQAEGCVSECACFMCVHTEASHAWNSVSVCACAEEEPTASISRSDGALLSALFSFASFRCELLRLFCQNFASYPNIHEG